MQFIFKYLFITSRLNPLQYDYFNIKQKEEQVFSDLQCKTIKNKCLISIIHILT